MNLGRLGPSQGACAGLEGERASEGVGLGGGSGHAEVAREGMGGVVGKG